MIIKKQDLDRDTLLCVAKSALGTKLQPDLTDLLTTVIKFKKI